MRKTRFSFLFVLTLLLALTLTACGDVAAGTSSKVMAVTAVTEATAPESQAENVVCGLRFDVTKSEHPVQWIAAVSASKEQVARIVAAFDCRTMRLTVFGDEAGYAKTIEITMLNVRRQAPPSVTEHPQLTDYMRQAAELKKQRDALINWQYVNDREDATADSVNKIQDWIQSNVRQQEAA